MKLRAVFSYRVATARHSLRRAQRRSTWLRLVCGEAVAERGDHAVF